MGGLSDLIFGKPKDPTPEPPIPPPDINREGEVARDRERRKRRRIAARGGRASTILTVRTPLGRASIGRRTLGGSE